MSNSCSSTFEHVTDAAKTIADRLEASGWTVDHQVLDELESDLRMSDPEAITTLMNPFRIRMMTALSRTPGSVKELSERLGVPVTRLYHHLGLLEEYGAVRVVGSRRSGARTERCYGAVRGGIGPAPDLLTKHPEAIAESVAKMVSFAGEAFSAAVRSGRIHMNDPENSEGFVNWFTPRLTHEQRRAIDDELKALSVRIGEMSAQNDVDGVADTEPTIMLLLSTPDVTAG